MTSTIFVAAYVFSAIFTFFSIMYIMFKQGDNFDDVSSIVIISCVPIINVLAWLIMQNSLNKGLKC